MQSASARSVTFLTGLLIRAMIESHYYKSDLLKYADSFELRSERQLWREDSLAKAEKQFFVGMFFVRKMIESVKVTDACKKTTHAVSRKKISPSMKITDFMRHDLMDYLDDESWNEEKVAVLQICDKVIHTWVNLPSRDDGSGLAGFILTTDKYRNSEIWFVPTKTIVEIFRQFGNSYPRSTESKRDVHGNIKYYRSE